MNNALSSQRESTSCLQELLPRSVINKLTEKKITFVQEHYAELMNFVTQGNITMPVLGNVLQSQDGEKKIHYILEENVMKLMKSKGFLPAQVMKILKGDGWEEKLSYIQQEHFKKIYNSGLDNCHIAGLFACGDWKEKLMFVMEHRQLLAYDIYKNYKKPVDIYRVLVKADWEKTPLVITMRQKGVK